jgi:hypothetical protein
MADGDFIFNLTTEGDIDYRIIVRGEDAIERALDRIDRWPRTQGKDLLDWLSKNAAFWIRIYAPTGETGGLQRHIDETPAHWHPGGAGGGGVYESSAGVRRIFGAQQNSSLYPLWVHEGTANKGRAFIYPADDRDPASVIATQRPRRRSGGVLTFQKQGEKRAFRWRVSGQKPNPFVYKAYQHVSVYTRTRMLTLGREIVGPGTPRRRTF